jgi:voltage-gated potassium channel
MRRAIAGTLLRSAAGSVVLIVAYYQAPLDRPLDAATKWLFLVALLVFAVFMAFQLRQIVRSDQPRLRAVRALSTGLPLLVVVFASTYCTIAGQDPDAFTEPLNRTDGLYFTVTVFSTVGFGDISPVSQLARVLVTVQMLVGLVTVGLIAKLIFGAVQVAVARRTAQPEPVDGD